MKNRLQSDLERQVEEHAMARWYLESLVSSMSEGLVVCTEQGMITSVNPVACKITGFKDGDLLGEPIFKFFPEGDVEDLITSILHQGPRKRVVCTLLNRVGQKRPVMLSGSVFKEDGQASDEVGSRILALVMQE